MHLLFVHALFTQRNGHESDGAARNMHGYRCIYVSIVLNMTFVFHRKILISTADNKEQDGYDGKARHDTANLLCEELVVAFEA